MTNVIAVRYKDAFYTYSFYTDKKKIKKNKLSLNTAIGKLVSIGNEHIILSFTEKDGTPLNGLLLPLGSLVFRGKLLSDKGFRFKLRPNKMYGIFWNDIVYFSDGKIPNSSTSMYTEGKVLATSRESVIIEKPKTLKMKGKEVSNRPKYDEPSFCIIPKAFITEVEEYDK